jgi:hypothetical protein
MRLAQGRLAEAVEELEIAAENTNFTMDAGYGALVASAVAGDLERLQRWLAFYEAPMWPGPVADRLRTVGRALHALRTGSDGPDDSAVGSAIDELVAGEDLLYAHLAALAWRELAPESQAAQRAADAAAAFFAEQGAAGFTERFRAAAADPGQAVLEPR